MPRYLIPGKGLFDADDRDFSDDENDDSQNEMDQFSLKHLKQMADEIRVPFDRFAMVLDEDYCGWGEAKETSNVLVTLGHVIKCATDEYPGVSDEELIFCVNVGAEDPEDVGSAAWFISTKSDLTEADPPIH